ncbi:MAG: hypothetical protein ABJN84_05590 [Flavobacteriaceae bacterium]
MENLENYFIVGGILGGLGQLLFVVGCILLMIKVRNKGTFLMLTAAVLSVLFSLGSFLWPYYAAQHGADFLARTAGVLNVLGQLPFILFTIGLLLFGMTLGKKGQQ